ncbi:MAG: aminotransferase class V-fold PLP-dependent enzyme, partial [Gemmatimonadota bacterium]
MSPDSAAGHRFSPDAAEVHPHILEALAHPLVSSRGPEMDEMVQSLRAPLKSLFRTSREVFVSAGSADGLMEAAIRCGVEERVLVIIGGASGEQFAQIALACGKEVVRVMVHPGRSLDPEHLAQFLDGPEVDAVALVHAEISTGALAPLADLTPVVRAKKDIHLLVDATGSLAGSPVETDAWGLDFVFAGSEKALALPPGLALGNASPRFLDRSRKLKGRGLYLDVARMADASSRNEPATTPAIPHWFALRAQLDRIDANGGIESRWKHHHEMLTMVEEWAILNPRVRLLAPEGRRAWTVSC